MSKSILGLKRTIPIKIGAILIRNAENPIKIGKVFMKKWLLSQQIDNLAISVLTSSKTRSFTCKTNKLNVFL